MQMKRFQWYFVGIFTLVWQIGGCSQADISTEVADFGTAKLEFLDVGQGLSVLIQSSSKERAFLYDAGNDSTGFWDSLHVRNIKHLDWALVSHWHRDHAGGFFSQKGGEVDGGGGGEDKRQRSMKGFSIKRNENGKESVRS